MNKIVQRIARKFRKEGYELYEVGGYVRDYILHRRSDDIDLCTNALPEKIKELIDGFGSVWQTGAEFGTIGLAVGDVKIEITTYREEYYTDDSRKPKVKFGKYLLDDLSRRDFTMNAIARNPLTGVMIDPFDGLADIGTRIIRPVGEASARFDEDPLRMLRAIRFSCQLGFKMGLWIDKPERLDKKNEEGKNVVSQERRRDELTKILLSDRPAWGIRMLCYTGLMQYIIPEFMDLKNVAQGEHHIKDAFEHSLLVLDKSAAYNHKDDNLVFRLAAMLHDIAKPDTKTVTYVDDGVNKAHVEIHFLGHQHVGAEKARFILRRLRFNNAIINRVCKLIKNHMNPIQLNKECVSGSIKERIVMKMIRSVGEESVYMLLDLVKCDIRSSKNPRYKFVGFLQGAVKSALTMKPSEIVSPIDGDEIMKVFQLKPSKIVGELKKYLTDLTVNGEIGKEDKDTAIAVGGEYLKGRGLLN